MSSDAEDSPAAAKQEPQGAHKTQQEWDMLETMKANAQKLPPSEQERLAMVRSCVNGSRYSCSLLALKPTHPHWPVRPVRPAQPV